MYAQQACFASLLINGYNLGNSYFFERFNLELLNAMTTASPTVINRKATHDYLIEQRYSAGLVLEGWEVKGLRAGRMQIRESHVIIKNHEAWLIGSHISPLNTVPAHLRVDPKRSRKLLLQASELKKLIGKVKQKGYTIVPLRVYWKRRFAKLEIALGKGKKTHDKRASNKERDWQREKARILKKDHES